MLANNPDISYHANSLDLANQIMCLGESLTGDLGTAAMASFKLFVQFENTATESDTKKTNISAFCASFRTQTEVWMSRDLDPDSLEQVNTTDDHARITFSDVHVLGTNQEF